MAIPPRPVDTITRPQNLVRTGLIALAVGIWLTAFNEGDRILQLDFGGLFALKVVLNFLTPFVVANLGLLAGSSARDPEG